MLFGIGILTVITAAITSTFVARSRLEQRARRTHRVRRRSSSVGSTAGSSASRPSLSSASHPEPSASDAGPPTAEHFRRLDERLDRIEAALTRPS